MQIYVAPAGDEILATLTDPQDFRGFAVGLAPSVTPEQVAAVASQLGSLEGDDHVFVSKAALTKLAGSLGQDRDWQSSLAQMVAYATSKGWVDDQGRIRAHIERLSDQ